MRRSCTATVLLSRAPHLVIAVRSLLAALKSQYISPVKTDIPTTTSKDFKSDLQNGRYQIYAPE